MAKIYLSLGTNLGCKEQNLRRAMQILNERIGETLSLSAFYETQAWGFHSDHSFLNAACCLETRLSPRQILVATQQIERELGRTRKSANGEYADRIIDIDLLFYDNQIINEPDLILPHPLLTQRIFVMTPLAEIASELIHPVLGKSIGELKKQL